MAETLIAGRYRLDELLGRGGMSEVWRATDLELDRRVALKLLAPRADVERFEREARAFAALAHPHVTQLYDYGEDGDRPYMVLEFVPGGTLEDRLQKGALPDAETHAIATDIASGLAHAHERGVVHRDIKPTNIVFDEEGRAKLTDFGIAQTAGDGTLTDEGTVLGTTAYISPEQASGSPTTPATDVYSFGVMLFRMLTGRLPFESNDALELIMLHRDAPAPAVEAFRPDAPPRLAALAAATLAKDPKARPQDGAALLAALDAGVAVTGVTQVMPPLPPPPARRRRRSPAVVFGLLLVLALAGVAVAYAITRPQSNPSAPPVTTGTGSSTALPTTSTHARTTTTAPTTSTTSPTTTVQVITVHTTTVHTTTAPPPPTTTAPPPPTTTAPPTTTTPTTTRP